MTVAEVIRAVVVSMKVVSLVYRLLCFSRTKVGAGALFQTGHTKPHSGLFENPIGMLFSGYWSQQGNESEKLVASTRIIASLSVPYTLCR